VKIKIAVGLTLVAAAGLAGAQPPGGGGGGAPTFEGLDTNKNGSLAKEEVAAFFAGRPAGPNGPPNVDEVFGRWDGNKDGSVSKAEFDARPRPAGPGGGPPPAAGGAPPAAPPPAR
jgi:hypothetical protein